MSRGLMVFNPAYRTPMDRLTITDSYLLELESCLHDIRVQANRLRVSPQLMEYERSHCRYLLGRLHGVRFGFSTLLIYKAGTYSDDIVSDAGDRAMSEADFLFDSYIFPASEEMREQRAAYCGSAS